MAKRTASTWIEPDLYERLLRVAKVDRRSLAEVLAMSVEHGLPLLEQELSHKLHPAAESLTETPPAYRVTTPTDPVAVAGQVATQAAQIVAPKAKRGGAPRKP